MRSKFKVCVGLLGAAGLVAGPLAGTATAVEDSDGPFNWELSDIYCPTSGGHYDLGYIKVRATATEKGKSGTNYIKLEFTRQESGDGVVWRNSGFQNTRESVHFADDSHSNSYSRAHTFGDTQGDVGSWVRFRVKFKFMHARTGPDKTLKNAALVTRGCVVTGSDDNGGGGPVPAAPHS